MDFLKRLADNKGLNRGPGRSGILTTLAGSGVNSLGIALSAFARVGMAPTGALQFALAQCLKMRLGSLSFLYRCFFIALQLLLEKKNFRPRQLLQLLAAACSGMLVNWILYGLLSQLPPLAYPVRLLLAVIGFGLNALGATIVLQSGWIRMPLEGVLLLLSKGSGRKVGWYKRRADWLFIGLALGIGALGGSAPTIREGTVLNALLSGLFLDRFRAPVSRCLRRMGIGTGESKAFIKTQE